MLLVATPCAVVFSAWIGVGGGVCPISSSDWRAGMAFLQLMKSALSSASAADHRRELPIIHYHEIIIIYPYPISVVINQFSPVQYLLMIIYVN